MGSSDEEMTEKKLSKKIKSVQLDDADTIDWNQIQNSFSEHFQPELCSKFSRGGKRSPLCLFTDLFCDGSAVGCGFDDGACKILQVDQLRSSEITLDKKTDWMHKGLSCIRCSRSSPSLFFTSSSSEGLVNAWDVREPSGKPCQKLSSENSSVKDGATAKKQILQFDISCNDQLICAGTELVGEDSYLLFWDMRSTKLLGAYWESHSDDVTAVRFHPNQVHSLATGSTDGLLNVFNLMEPEEDDSLQYSFNTNSSIDSITWHCSSPDVAKVACVTHTNEFQVWDALSGDRIVEFNRKSIADAMLRRNPDSVYVTSCYNLLENTSATGLGLLTCPMSGGNSRLIDLTDDNKLAPRGLFLDQNAIIQSAQFLPKEQQWITFDENRMVKLWKKGSQETKEEKSKSVKEIHKEERRNKKRFKPYQRD